MMRLGEVLIPADRIARRVAELGARISEDYRGRELLLVGVLKGAFVFTADLVRAVTIPLEIDFLGVASYGGGTAPSGELKVFKDLNRPVAGRDVLLVDDIVDTGRTTEALVRLLEVRRPRSLRVCALLDKQARRERTVRLDYVGFAVPDRFVVGYGLDLDEAFRNLPEIRAVDAGDTAAP